MNSPSHQSEKPTLEQGGLDVEDKVQDSDTVEVIDGVEEKTPTPNPPSPVDVILKWVLIGVLVLLASRFLGRFVSVLFRW